jgi:hypothetical protein
LKLNKFVVTNHTNRPKSDNYAIFGDFLHSRLKYSCPKIAEFWNEHSVPYIYGTMLKTQPVYFKKTDNYNFFSKFHFASEPKLFKIYPAKKLGDYRAEILKLALFDLDEVKNYLSIFELLLTI